MSSAMPVLEEAQPAIKHASIDKLVERIDGVSTLPQVALKVMDVARDPQSGAVDLKAVIEGDPSLCSRVLKNVNSASHGLQRKITNIQLAISYLGFKQIRNLALTASVSSLFKQDNLIGTYRRTMLWRHLVSVGLCARLIASRLQLPNYEDAFLAGLLHDLGIILIDQHAHTKFRKVMENLGDERCLTEIEQELLGFDHTTLGSRMAEKWRFPAVVIGAIRFHHRSDYYRGEGAEIVHCVELGNVICTLKDITSVGRKLTRLPKEALAKLKLAKQDILVLSEDLDQELAQQASLFKL